MIPNESMEDATVRLLQESLLSDMYDELPTDYDNKEVVDDSFVEGIIDDIIVVTDPDLDPDAYDELIARAQEIVANTPEGELPYTEDYLGKQLITCTACGNTFFSDEILQPGATCPVCKEIPEGFVVQGEVGKAEEVAQDVAGGENEKREKLAQKQAEQAAEMEQEENEELDLGTTETDLEELEASEEIKTGDNKLEESKELTESKIRYTYEVGIEGLQPVMFTDDTSVNDAKREYIENEGCRHDISEVKVHYFEEPVEAGLEENKDMTTESKQLKLEDLSNVVGGNYDEFISELQEFRTQMVDAVEEQTTKLASQVIMDTIEAFDNIIRKYEVEKNIEIEGVLNESVVAETTNEVLEESVTEKEVINLHELLENAEDALEIQDIIDSVSDNALQTELQHGYDQSIADEDELEVMKDFLIAVLEDNAEYED